MKRANFTSLVCILFLQLFTLQSAWCFPVQSLEFKIKTTARSSDDSIWGISSDYKVLILVKGPESKWKWIEAARPPGISGDARPYSLAADREKSVFILWKNENGFVITSHLGAEQAIIAAIDTSFENFERTTAFSESAMLFIDSKERLWVTHAAPSVYVMSRKGEMLATYKIGRDYFIRDAECGKIADWSPVVASESPDGSIFLWSLTATLRNRLYFPGMIRVDGLKFTHVIEAGNGKAITYFGPRDESSAYLLTRPETINRFEYANATTSEIPFTRSSEYTFPILARKVAGSEFVIMLTEFYEDSKSAGDLYVLKDSNYTRIQRGIDSGIPHWKAHLRPFLELDGMIFMGSFGRGLWVISTNDAGVKNLAQDFLGLPKGIDQMTVVGDFVLIISEDEPSVLVKLQDLKQSGRRALTIS